MSNAAIAREDRPGLRVTTVRRASAEEQYLTLWPLEGEPSEALFERFAQWLRESGARVLKQTVFGSLAASYKGRATLEGACGTVDWPITWIEGAACDGRPVAGLHAQLVCGVPVQTLRLHGHPVGRVYEDGCARYCVLGNIHTEETSAPAPIQARHLFERLESALALAGMSCTDVARTWLFLDRILDWYNDFNPVRTHFFRERGLFDTLVPASTGIGGANPAGAAILAEAYALQAIGPDASVVEVPSPLQCPAPAYGSAFSRAVEIAAAGIRHLLISGTASIEPGGKTAHPNDTPAQIERAMRVVEAILESREMGFADVSRAVVYFRNASEAPLFARYCAREGIPPFPAIVARDDICRDDLLFEIELDAVAEA
ncbi:MAG TPA: translation initiation inhibitor [Armatimonadetes bacterium]|nr:translation initiation inhibitor [Armatimonadota bacterium]